MDTKDEGAVIEATAAVMHEAWAHWTQYMMSRCGSGNFEQVQEDVLRWRRQCDTPYSELSEKEKESDREWARKVLEITEENHLRLMAEKDVAIANREQSWKNLVNECYEKDLRIISQNEEIAELKAKVLREFPQSKLDKNMKRWLSNFLDGSKETEWVKVSSSGCRDVFDLLKASLEKDKELTELAFGANRVNVAYAELECKIKKKDEEIAFLSDVAATRFELMKAQGMELVKLRNASADLASAVKIQSEEIEELNAEVREFKESLRKDLR
jgi:hypothetical protein